MIFDAINPKLSSALFSVEAGVVLDAAKKPSLPLLQRLPQVQAPGFWETVVAHQGTCVKTVSVNDAQLQITP